MIDLHYQPDNVVQWTIAVLDDGSARYGYAEYVCIVLGEHEARTPATAVRIVDAEEQRRHGDDYRAASLGAVQCRDASRLDDAPAVG